MGVRHRCVSTRGKSSGTEQERDILILETDGGPLIGMALLYGYRVTPDVVDGGPVTIAVLP